MWASTRVVPQFSIVSNLCKISKVTLKDLPNINELENQLNLNKTKLNFFNQTLSNENFKFIKLVLEKKIIGFLQFSLNKSDCDIISIGVTQKFQKMGHRQELTRVMVKSISIGKSVPKSASKKDTVKKEPKPKSEKSTN